MAFNPDLFGINIGQEFQSGLNNFAGYTDATTLSPQMVSLIQGDIRYLKSLGFKRFRFASPDYSWADRLTYQRAILELIAAEGNIHLEWGVGVQYGHKPSNWAAFINVVDSEIQWFQDLIEQHSSNGVTGVWMVDNEKDAYWAIGETEVVSNMTRASNVVTITFPFNHTFAVGDSIRISASNIVTPGGAYHTVTDVPTLTTLTINHSGDDGSENAGRVYFGPTCARNHIRRQAAHYRAIGITLPLSYNCPQGSEGAFNYLKPWRSSGGYPQEGQGDIDHVDLNIYGASNSNLETNWTAFKAQVDEAYSLFGTDCRITEWNNYEDDTAARVPNNDLGKRNELLLRRKNYIESKGMAHYYFAYRMPGKLAEKYPAYSNDGGGIRPSFFKLIDKRSPYIEIIPQ